jgi:hypothetical protein
MARATESYAVIWRGVILHIVDVMDMITALAAHLAGIVITLANHALEFIVEGRRVWLKRFAALPCVRISAIWFRCIGTRAATTSGFICAGFAYLIGYSTVLADFLDRPTLPMHSMFACANTGGAGSRAATGNVGTIRMDFKRPTAVKTYLGNFRLAVGNIWNTHSGYMSAFMRTISLPFDYLPGRKKHGSSASFASPNRFRLWCWHNSLLKERPRWQSVVVQATQANRGAYKQKTDNCICLNSWIIP